VYLLLCAINNEYTHHNRIIIVRQESVSHSLYSEIKELFSSHRGYTAAFWAKKIIAVPSIISTEIMRTPEKTWVVCIKQAQPKAVINEKFVFCDQGLFDRDYFADEQLTDCSQITTGIDYTYEQLCTFVPSLISIASTYTQKPSIHVNSPYDCFLTTNDITVRFGKNSLPLTQKIIEKTVATHSEMQKKKLPSIADIRFKNQIILHRPKVVSS